MKTSFMPTVMVAAALALAGCSSSSDSISSAYVSPLAYQSYNCDQIAEEIYRVSRRVQEVAGHQDDEATGDAVAVGVGLIVWPALLFLADGGDREAELARLKGEYDALEQSAVQKDCTDLLQQIERDRERTAETSEEKGQKVAQEE